LQPLLLSATLENWSKTLAFEHASLFYLKASSNFPQLSDLQLSSLFHGVIPATTLQLISFVLRHFNVFSISLSISLKCTIC
jgi:hypothetical protein